MTKIRRNNVGKKIVVKKDPIQASGVVHFKKAVRVTVNGEFVAWFAELPKKCRC